MAAPGNELRPLLAAMEELVPGVRGRIGQPGIGEIAPGQDNRAPVAALVSAVSARHPEAGAFFWSVRSWGLIEWQATALAVLGVHVAGIAAPVERVALSVGQGTAFAHALPPGGAERGPQPALIAIAGARLRARAEALLDDVSAVVPVKRSLTLRLLADRVLGILARLSAERSDLPADEAIAAARLWLSAIELQGASALVPVGLANGRVQPMLDRRTCCLDYRIAGGACCPSCPRLARAIRMERMRQHWEDHAGAR